MHLCAFPLFLLLHIVAATCVAPVSLALVLFLPTFWLLVVTVCHGLWPTMEVDTRQTPCVCFEVCLFQASAWSFSVILLRPSRARVTLRRMSASRVGTRSVSPVGTWIFVDAVLLCVAFAEMLCALERVASLLCVAIIPCLQIAVEWLRQRRSNGTFSAVLSFDYDCVFASRSWQIALELLHHGCDLNVRICTKHCFFG